MKNLRTFNQNNQKVELKKGYSNTYKCEVYTIFTNDIEVKTYPIEYKQLAEEAYKKAIKTAKGE